MYRNPLCLLQNTNFGVNTENYKGLVEMLLECFHHFESNLNIKINFLNSHLDEFSANPGNLSGERSENLYQDINLMEGRCQSQRNSHVIADYF